MSDRKLRITGNHRIVEEPHVSVTDDVVIVVTQAYGPRGDNLVGISDVTFDGHPAVTLGVRTSGIDGLVHLSPIHGDDRTPQLSHGSMVMVSNVWGHYHSRIVDNFELISAWASAHDELPDN
jgi:hypothetical protein